MYKLFFILIIYSINLSAGVLTSIESTANGSIKLNIKGDYTYKYFTLENPHRLVFDLTNVQKSNAYKTSVQKNSLIKTIRFGIKDAKTLRVVIEVNEALQYKVNKNMGLEIKVTPKITKNMAPKTIKPKSFNKNTLNKNTQQRDVIIAIDPGHGGKDPGAIGYKNAREKDIVLNIAVELKKLIDKQPGMTAILTRNGDYYVGLRQRLAIARKHNADALISIHADSYVNKESHGASVFALSARGATSEAARLLAAKENHAELGGVDLTNLDDKDDLVRSVLIDLSQTATISLSLEMGQRILQNFAKITTLHKENVEQARFVVLKSPDIPSVLIETGFISNNKEALNLTDKKYQQKITYAIFTGIKQYFLAYPPRHTLMEDISGIMTQFVQRENNPLAMLYHLNDLERA